MTCGAIVIDNDMRILHIHHKTTGKYLTPGGHIEPADTPLTAAALRELHEETSLPPTALTPLPNFDDIPLDIFVEVGPVIDFTPKLQGGVTGGIGARYWF